MIFFLNYPSNDFFFEKNFILLILLHDEKMSFTLFIHHDLFP